MKSLFTRGRHVYQDEGLGSLLKRGLAFASSLIFQYQTYYLYMEPLEGLRLPNEVDIRPKVDNLTFRIATTNREADELEAEGFEFRSQLFNARERLDKGATAFCIFVGRELVNIGWFALTQQAMHSLGHLPFKVDFCKNEAYMAGLWTNPKYRRMGMHMYGYFKRLEYLQANGILTERYVIAKGNVAAQNVGALRGALPFLGPYAEARYIKMLWWKSWREKPLTHPPLQAQGPPNG